MDQNCFESLDQIQETIQNDQHQFPILNISLQANPILPQGLHIQNSNESINYKLDVANQTIGHNKKSNLPKLQIMNTTFNENKKRYTLFHNTIFNFGETLHNHRMLHNKNKRIVRQKLNNLKQDNEIDEFYEYVNEDDLIYKRLNNNSLNYFAKNGKKYYASLFLDLKQFEKNKKMIDVYQHLTKIYPYQSQDPYTPQLKFDSNFQGANLFSVYKIAEKQYNCFMQNDINTKGCTQWFYFKIKNFKKLKVKINIINFYKPSSLYSKGMKPLIFSTEKYKLYKEDWKRGGQSISYQESVVANDIQYYKLSFLYEFEYINDEVYFAYSFPYNYSELKKYLERLQQNQNYKKILKSEILCKTFLKNNVYLLEISEDINAKQLKKKEIIYIIARQHPGQTPASFVIEGVIHFLLSNRLQSFELRSKFVFKIIPMVNPDGVINGNYRTNISGNDINRKWNFPNKTYHPEVFNIKKRISQDKSLIRMFLDLHAHSRKMNSFFYGENQDNNLHKFYPFICSKFNKNISYDQCSYLNDPQKKSTARVIIQDQFFIKKSYTFQTSFYGRERNGKKQHFQKSDLRDLGESLMIGIFYTELKMNEESKWYILNKLKFIKKSSTNLQTLEEKYMKQINLIQNIVSQLQQKWKKQLIINNQTDDSVGSDSDPEEFQLRQKELQQFDNLHSELQNSIPKINNQEKKIKRFLPNNTINFKFEYDRVKAKNVKLDKQIQKIEPKQGNHINIQQISLCFQSRNKDQFPQKNDKNRIIKSQHKKIAQIPILNTIIGNTERNQRKYINRLNINHNSKNNLGNKNINMTIQRPYKSYDEKMNIINFIPMSYNKSLQKTRIFKMNGIKNLKNLNDKTEIKS